MPNTSTISLRRLPALLFRLRATLLYVTLIPFLNWAFEHIPMFINFSDGGSFNPLSILVGLILVVRDFAQREIGHWVFVPFIIACAISYALSSPALAIASTASFAVSELVDWAVFTLTRRPLSKRILWSAGLAVPVDTAIFLYGLSLVHPGAATPTTFAGMIISKLAGVYAVYLMVKRRERKLAEGAAIPLDSQPMIEALPEMVEQAS